MNSIRFNFRLSEKWCLSVDIQWGDRDNVTVMLYEQREDSRLE